MSLAERRKSLGLSQAKLAEMLTAAGFPTSQGVVSQWEGGLVALGAERAVQIEQVTKRAIRREHLRPDLFGEVAAANDADPDADRIGPPVETA